jgi:cytochrome c-type biogenesis protein CcmE
VKNGFGGLKGLMRSTGSFFLLYLCAVFTYDMKKIHIVLLILIVAAISGMSFFIKDLTTYETFESAQQKNNKFVVVKVKLDKASPIEYNQVKDPNLTVFYALDQDGKKSKVVYKNAKPTDMEKSEGLDLNGYMRDGYFECTKLQMKCPSKYKDNMQAAERNLAASIDSAKKY